MHLQASQGRSLSGLAVILCTPGVWATAFISSSIAAASCLVNDYFDFVTGVDSQNAPHKVNGTTQMCSASESGK